MKHSVLNSKRTSCTWYEIHLCSFDLQTVIRHVKVNGENLIAMYQKLVFYIRKLRSSRVRGLFQGY